MSFYLHKCPLVRFMLRYDGFSNFSCLLYFIELVKINIRHQKNKNKKKPTWNIFRITDDATQKYQKS